MRRLCVAIAGLLALGWAVEAAAAGRAKARSTRSAESTRSDSTTRSNTVAPSGLCQRDTGTHNSKLDFGNKCDIQEFWARQRDGARR